MDGENFGLICRKTAFSAYLTTYGVRLGTMSNGRRRRPCFSLLSLASPPSTMSRLALASPKPRPCR